MDVFKQSIVIDIDGTLYEKFERNDKNIISRLFKNNHLVKLLDKLLWNINSLDIISNSMFILKLRLFIYSILSFKSFKKTEREYRRRYQLLLGLDLENKRKILKKINEKYEIILVSNNLYAINVLCKFQDYNIIYSSNVCSRRTQIKEINAFESIAYVIGNNYKDDISLAKSIDALSIYLGDSVFKKSFKADFNISTFNEVLEILKVSP